MKKIKQIHQTIWFILCLTIIFILFPDRTEAKGTIPVSGNSVYCWYESDLDEPEPVIEYLHELGVAELYLNLSDPEDQSGLIDLLSERGIAVYDLKGRPEWYVDPDSVTQRIDELLSYNGAHADHRITGITLDIEPYVLDEFNEDPIGGMEDLAETVETIYSYAAENGVKVVLSIPYWYDDYTTDDSYFVKERELAEEAFRRIFQSCDRISVMNYTRNNMTKHIKEEIELAEEYDKEIESAADFCPDSDTEDGTTFYSEEDPLGAAVAAWSEIAAQYHYKKLHFAYHHLGMLLVIKSRPSAVSQTEEKKKETGKSDGSTDRTVKDKVFVYGKCRYRILNEKEVSCLGTAGRTAKTIRIPDTVFAGKSAYKVIRVEKEAFRRDTKLSKISIPSCVQKIGANAFRDCKKLKSITIRAGGLKKVGKNAFRGISAKARFHLKGSAKEKRKLKKYLKKYT